MAYSLASNEIFSGLFNMIISQTMFTPDLDVDDFVSQFRVDGSMYGDRKIYYSADVLASEAWGKDSAAANLLALKRPKTPAVQDVIIDQFRQITLTVDDYLSKRAWADEGAFAQFNSVMLGMIAETKKVIDYTLLATFIGTHTATGAAQAKTVVAGATAQQIAQKIADVLVDMKRPSRDYNDNGFMRAYAPSKLKMIWNAKYINQIKKLELPTIFNAEMIDVVNGDVLPPEYFGTKNGSTGTGNGTTIRTLVEKDYAKSGSPTVHCFPGDLVPNGYSYAKDETYTVDDKVVCKIIGVGAVPFMSGFEVGTSFFNAKSLTTNHYLTWGYNTLEHLADKPFVTITESAS